MNKAEYDVAISDLDERFTLALVSRDYAEADRVQKEKIQLRKNGWEDAGTPTP